MNSPKISQDTDQWQIWIDHGCTFTDVVARKSNGQLASKKLLSKNNESFEDAAMHAIQELLNIDVDKNIPTGSIRPVEIGTSIASSALLQHKGQPTFLAVTEGLEGLVEIDYRVKENCPAINKDLVCNKVIGIRERICASGDVCTTINLERTRSLLVQSYNSGYRSIAIVLMNSTKYPEHEKIVSELAIQIGFTEIITSHEGAPVAKLITEGDATIIETYLVPILRQYINRVTDAIDC
ncbi:MAG: 5-oxoprolinase (ATP-hydrolyzing) [Porticoccaceae bacterium]|jgi:5-oxoprolinase (ATP-hydrolysing)